MTTGDTVSLRPVTRANVRAVCDLELADGQRHLVAPTAYTVAEGNYEPGALLRAIYRGERPVGVLLVEVESGTPYLVLAALRVPVERSRTSRRPGGRPRALAEAAQGQPAEQREPGRQRDQVRQRRQQLAAAERRVERG
jgi:hypothetical protein